MESKTTREFYFTPAYDYIGTDKEKYGIHTVQGHMIVKGDKGCTHFTFGTGLYLPKTIKRWDKQNLKAETRELLTRGMGYDVGYHSLTPRYEGQEVSQEKCMFLDNKTCYWDGSALRAEKFWNILLSEGEEPIWKELEKDYAYYYEKGGN